MNMPKEMSITLERVNNMPNIIWIIEPLLCIVTIVNTVFTNLFFSPHQVYYVREKKKKKNQQEKAINIPR